MNFYILILILMPIFTLDLSLLVLDEIKSMPRVLNYVIFCSSLGQNLKTSTNVAEIAFAIFISIFGLVLFSLLIGNMQVIVHKDYLIIKQAMLNPFCLLKSLYIVLNIVSEISAIYNC